jgi:YjbE family integral membrane protein
MFDFFTADFFVNLLSIIMIDIVLAGDNSIVIAMAVQTLPKKRRFKGIVFGALAAVFLRVLFTVFAAQLLMVSFVKFVGGLLIFWIAIKLLNDGEKEHKKGKGATSIWGAVWMIIVADLTMSLDNVLAVAGASHGSVALLIFGLGLSIPLVVFASTLISKLMERFSIIIWLGGLILGKVAAEMVVTDPWMTLHVWSPLGLTIVKNGVATLGRLPVVVSEAIGVLGVLGIALLVRKVKSEKTKAKPEN